MPQTPSRGYMSRAYTAVEPSAYIEILQADFGAAAYTGALTLAYNAGGGSLGSGTARCAITWVTTAGESLASAENTVAISAGSGAFTVTQPTPPQVTNGITILGWRVYSSSGAAGSALLNTTGTVQSQQNFTTTEGTLLAFPLSTTSVEIQSYGTGQPEPTVDLSGYQFALPVIPLESTLDYFFQVPNTGSRWRTQKTVEWMRPQGLAETGGLTIGPMDCIAPAYPGISATVTVPLVSGVPNYSGTSTPAVNQFFVLNGYLFVAYKSGTTAATFIGFSAFNTTRFGITTDGTAQWMCLGHKILVRSHFGNASAAAATPIVQEYDLFEG